MEKEYTDHLIREAAEDYAAREPLSFQILEHIGTLRTNASGWSREFNIVSWNSNKPKFDIRDWSEDHSKMSRGITMTNVEVKRIYDWITERGLEKIAPEE